MIVRFNSLFYCVFRRSSYNIHFILILAGESQELERGGVVGAKKKSSTSASAMTTVEGGVKSERLSPSSSGGCAGGDTSSSRSGTPSSSCTPPRQGASPSQHLPLAARNYSDFMRSLAAKYNNNNPTE